MPRRTFVFSIRIFVAMALLPVFVHATNLLSNPGFESGLSGWTLQGPAVFSVDSSAPYEGRRNLSIRVGPDTSLVYQQANQVVVAHAGDRMVGSSLCRTSGIAATPGAYTYVEALDSSGRRISIVQSPQLRDSTAGTWTPTRILTEPLPAGTAKARFGLAVQAHGTASYDAAFFGPASDSDTTALLDVHPQDTVLRRFLGVNAVYHGFAYMPEEIDRGMDSADRAREFDRVSKMGLRIARTWYRPDWACANGAAKPCDWDSPRMKAFYKWLQEMKDRGVDVALNLGWWFPVDTYLGQAAPDPALDTVRFPAWVSESVRQIVDVRGFSNVKYGMALTEPSGNPTAVVPAGFTKWDYYAAMVRSIHRRLVADGLRGRIRLVGPDNSSGGVDLDKAVAQLDDAIDIYSGHAYDMAGFSGWFSMCSNMARLVAPTGKPLWMDEYGKTGEANRASPDYGTYLAEAVAASLRAGVQTTLVWLLFDQQYVPPVDKVTNSDSFHGGVHRWGSWRWPHDTVDSIAYPSPHWYALSMMSRHLPEGASVLGATVDKGVVLVAVDLAGERTYLVVNTNPRATRIRLQTAAPDPSTFRKVLYDPANLPRTTRTELLSVDSATPPSGGVYGDLIPARGVAVLGSSLGDPPAPTRVERHPPRTPIRGTIAGGRDPAEGGVLVRFAGFPAGRATYSIHDVRGAEVARFDFGMVAVGMELRWSGADPMGRTVRPGLYVGRLQQDGQLPAEHRLILVR